MRHRLLPMLIVLGLLLGLPLSASPALAVPPPTFITLVVDTSRDSNDSSYQACTPAFLGDCSLRGAISRVNADPDSIYTIELPSGTFLLTLEGPHQNDNNELGDLDITGGVVIIRGTGAANVSIDATGVHDRVFDIHAGAVVVLEDLTVTGGRSRPNALMGGASGSDGGGLRNAGNLTLRHVTVAGNAASNGVAYSGNAGAGGRGGGIYNTGTLVLEGVTLGDNASGSGGNSAAAVGGRGGAGGGIFNAGTALLTESSVISSTTGRGGTGVSGGQGGAGGGIYNTGVMTLTRITFEGNGTGNGGAATCATSGCSAAGGAAGSGGGIYNAGTMTLTAVTLSGSTTGGGGSASCATTGCSATGGSGGAGGGIYQASGVALAMTGGAITGGGAGAGGTASGVTAHPGSGGDGGGMYSAADDVVLVSVAISDNTLVAGNGGGFYSAGGDSQLIGVAFTGNQVYGGGSGGAVYLQSGAPTLVNCIVNGNLANGYGGGIFIAGGSAVLAQMTLSGNEALWEKGAGIYNAGTGTPVVRNSIVWGNAGGAQIEATTGSPLPDVQTTLVAGGYPGTGNVDIDPGFVRNPDSGDGSWASRNDNDYGDLRLRFSSGAIDAGDNSAVPAGITADFDGNPRFVDIVSVADTGIGTPPLVDLGAYEAQLTPAPFFTSTPITVAVAGGPYAYTVTVDDPDLPHDEVLTVSAPVLPDWLTLVQTGVTTATLSGTPSLVAVGEHPVELRVTDLAGSFAKQVFVIKVSAREATSFTVYVPLVLRVAR
jgi:hypothetical protein